VSGREAAERPLAIGELGAYRHSDGEQGDISGRRAGAASRNNRGMDISLPMLTQVLQNVLTILKGSVSDIRCSPPRPWSAIRRSSNFYTASQ
jgi:hypothetical protein